MRTERTMPSSVMLRLFMTDWSACAFRLALTSARSAPTDTSITTAKSATATIISTRVKPEDCVVLRFILLLAALYRYLAIGLDNYTHDIPSRRFENDMSILITCSPLIWYTGRVTNVYPCTYPRIRFGAYKNDIDVALRVTGSAARGRTAEILNAEPAGDISRLHELAGIRPRIRTVVETVYGKRICKERICVGIRGVEMYPVSCAEVVLPEARDRNAIHL